MRSSNMLICLDIYPQAGGDTLRHSAISVRPSLEPFQLGVVFVGDRSEQFRVVSSHLGLLAF